MRSLELKDVSVDYPAVRRGGKRVRALDRVSFALQPGEVVGLVGANGAGKTSLIELAIGALRPTTGTLVVLDSIAESVRHRVGFAPDVPAFPGSLTVAEVIRFFAGLAGTPLRDALTRVDAVREPLELGPIWDRRIETLSRGNLQKVGLAQALLRAPDLLLCDEPFGALDPLVQVGLRGVLQAEASRGAAVLVSSHQLDQVERVADRVLVLDQGILVADFGPRELRAGWLVELACPFAITEIEQSLRRHWSFVARNVDRLTIPWTSSAVDPAELRQLLPDGSPVPTVTSIVPLSLEAVLLSSLRRN